MSVAENILDAVDILMDKKVSELQFNKTIRGKIAEVTDPSIGKYKVKYQNSYFTAYSSDSSAIYQRGSEVYVEILSNDFEKNALILGTVQRLGSNYISVVDKLDKYTTVGQKFIYNGTWTTSSYKTSSSGTNSQSKTLYSGDGTNLNLNETIAWNTETDSTLFTRQKFINAIAQAAAAADSIKLGLTIENHLDLEQRTNGRFGLQVKVEYYNDRYVDKQNAYDHANDTDSSTQTAAGILTRTYTFDLNQMTGQPYKYIVPVKQYGIFTIDAVNFARIVSISAFKQSFPINDNSKPNDITFSDIHLQFLKSLTDEDLQNSSLQILAPQGAYFEAGDSDTITKILKAELKIKGKKVNYQVQQVIDFYWFRQNNSITNSSVEGFSPYGGNGWEWLNTKVTANAYTYNLQKSLCQNDKTKFKCVAVYNDNGIITINVAHIMIENLGSKYHLNITSSSGTVFSFNTGKTTLTVVGMDGQTSLYDYKWTRSFDGEPAYNLSTTTNTYAPNINNPATRFIIFECSVFLKGDNSLIGTASITLHNNKESNGCTLVLRNGIQVFKYDEYGTAPTSSYKAAAQRMTASALAFDIYDKQGNLINISSNKSRFMDIKWIWPKDPASADETWEESTNKLATMLTTGETLTNIEVPNLISGRTVHKFALLGADTFSYGILNKYNATYANSSSSQNNIRLEVDYQGEHLVATTDFTFTKEGELGTNGTSYLARIVPKGRVYVLGKTGGSYVNTSSQGVTANISNLFTAELWSDTIGKINASLLTIEWSISTNSRRTIDIPKVGSVKAHKAQTRLTINQNKTITVDGSTTEECFCDIIQACIIYEDRRYYATYAIPYIERSSNSDPILWLDQGYKEVMYQSDGTRGAFDGLPFKAMKISGSNLAEIGNTKNSDITWLSSWGIDARTVPGELINQRYIDPPSFYIGDENYKSYIQVTYGKSKGYFPIQFYLNRYGMPAMNQWDGQSIEINKDDKGYILAPQIAAGKKDNNNSFTGIAMGQTFQTVEGNKTGLFGYANGEQTIFLDADTGNAHFGKANSARINIAASSYGIAPAGSLYSGNYYSAYKDDGKPKTKGSAGMLIDLTTPEIRFGSGNFSVTKDGYLTAKGGGSIAAWKIDNNSLKSQDDKTILYAQNGPNMQLDSSSSAEAYKDAKNTSIKWNTNKQTRFAIGNQFQINEDGAFKSTAGLIGGWRIGTDTLQSRDGKTTLYSTYHKNKDGSDNNDGLRLSIGEGTFAVYQDGRFQAANAKFEVTADGTIKSTAGTIGGWHINAHNLLAKDSNNVTTLQLNDDGSIYGPNASYRFSPHQKIWEITKGGVAYFTDVQIQNKQSVGNSFKWTNNSGANIFQLTDTGSKIGGWNITGDELSSGNIHITSNRSGKAESVISVTDALTIYGNGNIESTGSGDFNGTLSGSSCSFGSGTIGSANFGADGIWADAGKKNGISSDGSLHLDGNALKASSIAYITGIAPKATLNPGTTTASASVDFGGFTFYDNEGMSHYVTIGTKTFDFDVPNNTYTFGGTFSTSAAQVARNSDITDTTGLPIIWNS